jgi:hypothetical protein
MENKRLKTTIGFLLMPIVFVLFMIDRVILVFMIHIEAKAIQNYFFDAQQIVHSLWRLVSVSIFLLITFLMFNRFFA